MSLSRSSQKDAYHLILEAIDVGVYKPGDRLVESDLAERFGVMLIARAKGKSFQAINAAGRLTLDAIPPKPPSARSSKEAGV